MFLLLLVSAYPNWLFHLPCDIVVACSYETTDLICTSSMQTCMHEVAPAISYRSVRCAIHPAEA